MSENLQQEQPTAEQYPIINDRPPIFEKILAAFPGADNPNVLFAYDGAIYNPGAHKLPPELIDHESVHLDRQKEIGADVWWEQYINDGSFRYEEEYLAHLAELKSIVARMPNAKSRDNAVDHITRKLVAPLYDHKIPFHVAHARLRRGLRDG